MTAASTNPANEPDDPQGLIRQVLAMGAEFPGPAGDVLLSWVLELKDRADPAKAAARLIERHGLAEPDRDQSNPAPTLTASARITVLKKNDSTQWTSVRRRSGDDATCTSET